MVSFFGDYSTTETVIIPFNTFTSDDPSASSTITNLAAGDVEIHKDGSTTQRASDAGVTVTINFDSITGNHIVSIDLSDNTDAGFYEAGSRYQVRMEGTTVDGATINAWIGAFSIGCTLRPATDGRTVVVDADGLVDANTVKIGPTGSGTAQTANDVGGDVNTILTDTNELQTDDIPGTLSTMDGKIDTAQADLDTLTGADGATLASAQGNYAPNTVVPDAAGTAPTASEIQTEMEANGASILDTLQDRLTAARAGYLDNINGHTAQTGDSFARIGANGASLTDLATAAKLLSYVQLLARSDAAIETDNATELTAINADGGSGAGNFSAQTDSEEALRDHIGDGTNLTEAGGDGDHLVESGGTGDQLTAIPWNSSWDAEVQSEVADALTVYAPNTVVPGITKNATFSNLEFLMVDETDFATPETGLTVTGQRSIDGAAFGAVAGSIAEVGSGIYQFDALAADMNGDVITFKFSSTGAADTFVTVVTTS